MNVNTAPGTSKNLNDASQKIRNIRDEAKEGLEEAVPAVREGLNMAKEKIGDFARTFKDRSKDWSRNLDTEVHTSPWRYIGGIALASFVCGLLIARRRY